MKIVGLTRQQIMTTLIQGSLIASQKYLELQHILKQQIHDFGKQKAIPPKANIIEAHFNVLNIVEGCL